MFLVRFYVIAFGRAMRQSRVCRALKRNGLRLNRPFALACCLSMIFSENRYTHFSGSCFSLTSAQAPVALAVTFRALSRHLWRFCRDRAEHHGGRDTASLEKRGAAAVRPEPVSDQARSRS